MRQLSIFFFGRVTGDQTFQQISAAVSMNPGLASDDTLTQICNLLGERPPAMARLLDARRAAAAKKLPPASTKPVQVVYRMPSEGVIIPNSSPIIGAHGVYASEEHWPRVLQKVAPVDPRGPGAEEVVVLANVTVEADGKASKASAWGGTPELNSAAENALMQWTYKPFTYLGVPIPTTGQVEVHIGMKSASGMPAFGEYVPVDELPQAMQHPEPVYDESLKQRGIEGTVLVQALVAKDGTVVETRVTKSIPELDEAAVASVRKWTFSPAKNKGVPTAV